MLHSQVRIRKYKKFIEINNVVNYTILFESSTTIYVKSSYNVCAHDLWLSFGPSYSNSQNYIYTIYVKYIYFLSFSPIAQVARSLRQSDQSRTHSRRGSRGVTVSSSRATAARAAAILLVSCHLNQELPGKSLGKL